jgi:TPR repeat protein
MAATHDPIELSLLGARGVRADPATAKMWYERARQLGATEAEERLKRLGAR